MVLNPALGTVYNKHPQESKENRGESILCNGVEGICDTAIVMSPQVTYSNKREKAVESHDCPRPEGTLSMGKERERGKESSSLNYFLCLFRSKPTSVAPLKIKNLFHKSISFRNV